MRWGRKYIVVPTSMGHHLNQAIRVDAIRSRLSFPFTRICLWEPAFLRLFDIAYTVGCLRFEGWWGETFVHLRLEWLLRTVALFRCQSVTVTNSGKHGE